MNNNNNHQFYNPYHFVPVENPASDTLPLRQLEDLQAGALDSSNQHLSHDRYHGPEDNGYSGRILCQLTTQTPLVIGSEQIGGEKAAGGQKGTPNQIKNYQIDGSPAIPPTSLRGLFGSIIEAASNSAMRVLIDQPLSYRSSVRNQDHHRSAIGMIVEERDAGDVKLRLLPLTLPTLEIKNEGGTVSAEIPKEFQTIAHKLVLPVYLDGYQRGRDGLSTVPRSFLDRDPTIHSCSSSNHEFWALQLKGGIAIKKDRLHASNGSIKVKKAGRSAFVLGQQAAHSPAKPQRIDNPEKAPPNTVPGILRVLGIEGRESNMPTSKKHELFIPLPDLDYFNNGTKLDIDEALQKFYALADQRTEENESLPYELAGQSREKKDNRIRFHHGDLVHFRLKLDSDEPIVDSIAISSIWREECGSLYDYIASLSPELLPWNQARTMVTIAEQMLGFVASTSKDSNEEEENAAWPSAFASRIRFSYGRHLSQSGKSPYLPEQTLKILSSPKPPCPSLYFTQKSGTPGYIDKAILNPVDHKPLGRKFYLHQNPDREPWRTRAEHSGNHPDPLIHQKACVSPIATGESFLFHVDFENLTKRELALLSYALCPTGEFRHKLGMGKPLGLGTVRIAPLGIFYIDRNHRCRKQALFDSERYHACRPHHDGEGRIIEYVNSMYPEESAALNKQSAAGQEKDADTIWPAMDDLRRHWRDTCQHPAVLDALETIGNPNSTAGKTVHYPQQAGISPDNPEFEKELYKWFVNNDHSDKHPKQCLHPITQRNIAPLTANQPPPRGRGPRSKQANKRKRY